MKNISLQLGKRYSYYTITVSELQNLQTQFSINRRRQRKYLFNDIPGKKGHSWQRDIFLSLVLGNPLPQFELTDLGNGKYLIEDGQQRTYTILAILTDCVKLPKEIESFGPEFAGLANKSFSELPPEMIKSSSGKMVGLSVTAFSSLVNIDSTCCKTPYDAPIT